MKTTTTNTLNLSETCPVQPDHLRASCVSHLDAYYVLLSVVLENPNILETV
jgi:hypothetical protein